MQKVSGQSSFNFQDESVVRTVNHKHKKLITFKGGQERFAHRWFRLTPSFSPALVEDIIKRYGVTTTRVLDPFAGRGTTPIECQLLGVPCLGIEINPALHFAGSASLNWNVDADELKLTFDRVFDASCTLRAKYRSVGADVVSAELGIGIPPIHNVYRWWRADVLRDLLLLKHSVLNFSLHHEHQDLLLLALMSILLDSANITLSRLQLHFVDRSSDLIDPFGLFAKAVSVILEDIRALAIRLTTTKSKILLGDNKNVPAEVRAFKASLVITSPPYPNRYSYVWNTRPHLYFMGWFSTPTEAATLDCNTVGGTWGTATSRHQKNRYEFSASCVESVVGNIVERIRKDDLLMSNYVAMYFDDLFKGIGELKSCLAEGAVCAYVVGNSRMKGSVVETDTLLAKLFEHQGFAALGNEEIRRRNSGKELHETIVFAKYL